MAKKIPLPKVKSKKMPLLEKIFAGIAGLSPFTAGRPHLYQSMTSQTPAGRKAAAKHAANLLAKYGKWGTRAATLSGLTNPYVSIPLALLYGAKYAVGSAMEPYMNQDVEDTGWFFDNRGISEEGAERLLRERVAREERARASAAKRGELAWMDDPNFDFWGGGLKASKLADYPELAKKYDMNEGGIARLL